MDDNLIEISRTVSYALRHNPDEFNLILDDSGWVLVDELINEIKNKHSNWDWISDLTLIEIQEQSDKQRFEIKDGSIRAMYGHSLPKQRIFLSASQPPDILYHGTTEQATASIKDKGLQPMQRQYVHLSADKETAIIVGKRRCKKPVILIIDAKAASARGVKFYHANEKIWLANSVSEKYIAKYNQF